MATCKDCTHKDVCYLIEHYGKDLCSDDACDKFLVTPVVHGHWIAEYDCGYITPHCSECGETALTKEETGYDYVYSSYCPRCGVRMDGNEVE